MRLARLLVICFVIVLGPNTAAAQTGPASLVADSVLVDPTGRITATGNVEVFQDGIRLTASEVIYDRNTDELTVVGPITITEPSGAVFEADEASLSPSLRTGILTSARIVLDQQLQLAAVEIANVNERYSVFDRVVASSCRVCATNDVPLWEIRARRVIRDTLERQIYFEGAQFRVGGVPLAYIPRLRLPDPSVERSAGVLIPRLRTTSALGTGLKVPYFLPIGDHADLTLTPYVSTSTQTVEFRYRQEFRAGDVQIDGAVTEDDLEGARAYLFTNARLRLPQDFIARLRLEFASDPGYLFQYDYSERDRLTNEIRFTRARDRDLFRAGLTEYRTLRDDEIDARDTLPDRYAELSYQREIPEFAFGGVTYARVDSATLNRPSSADTLGRDTSRVGVGLDWKGSTVFGPGLVASGELGIRIDTFNTGQDSNFSQNVTRTIPRTALELRWPHARSTGTAHEVLEPIVRLDVAEVRGQNVPLEDSLIVEFDEANLFASTRYPGLDGAEDGVRVAVGTSWRRQSDTGWMTDLTFGRVTNLDGDLGFAEGTGLEGDQSEWLLAGRIVFGPNLWAASRALFDDNFNFTINETRIDWQSSISSLSASYIQAVPEPAEERNDRLSEFSFEGSVALNEQWRLLSNVRYDFTAGRAARSGLGLNYRNECVALDFSLSRRFASSASVQPTTDFGFRVSLLGLGERREGETATRACRG